ncbi:MAG: glycine cleavage system protein H [Candidatus Marinimicrobia bacterium]|nr:glycine cleavage system protein H [Candidatus Neomarinimicrobiota bacterium]|tara:strand:- start:14576 stop:14962 length:387 start_codon:yes stop_codon:yes gene_type:complete
MKDLKYTKEHEWLKLEDPSLKTSKNAYVGITDFAQGELGDVVFVELPNIDDEFSQNDVFGTIEAVKTLADLYIPVSAKIIEINEALEDQPELVNSDPYNEGWIVKIELSDSSELDSLLDLDSYNELIS